MTGPNNLSGRQAWRPFFVTKTQPAKVVPDAECIYDERACGVTGHSGHAEAWSHGAGSGCPGNPSTKGAQASVVRHLEFNAYSGSAISQHFCLPQAAGVRMRGPPTPQALANRGPPKRKTAADRANSWS